MSDFYHAVGIDHKEWLPVLSAPHVVHAVSGWNSGTTSESCLVSWWSHLVFAVSTRREATRISGGYGTAMKT